MAMMDRESITPVNSLVNWHGLSLIKPVPPVPTSKDHLSSESE